MARNPAVRSSILTCSLSLPARSASDSAEAGRYAAEGDVAHTAADQFVDDDTRLGRRRIHRYSVSRP